MNRWKRGSGRLAALTGAALVVPLAVGATVVAAEPDEPEATRPPVAAQQRSSTASESGSPPPLVADRNAGAVDEPNTGVPVNERRQPASPAPDAPAGQAGSLAEVAGRKPPASRAEAPQAGGLERAAGRKPENGKGTRGRSDEARDRTRGLTQRAAVAPDKVLDGDTAPGGCLAEYGEDGQCLPTIPPSLAKHVLDMKKSGQDPSSMPHNWDCSEVRTYFADGITVRQAGQDPQSLDTNKDGVACGGGD